MKTANQIDLAFTRFVTEIRPKLLIAVTRMLGHAEAEEVIQESFIKLLALGDFNQIDNPKAFVYKVSRNLAISRLRNQTTIRNNVNRTLDEQKFDTAGPRLDYSLNEEKRLILKALNELPPICRQVFVMRKLHGKSHQEIALNMNISTKTVENHISNGMRLCLKYISTTRKLDATILESLRGAG